MRLIFLALAWMLGIIFADANPSDASRWLIPLLLILFAVLLQRKSRYFRWLLLALAFFAGALRLSLAPASDALADVHQGSTLTLIGIVDSYPERREDAQRFQMRVEALRSQGRIESIEGRVLVETPATHGLRWGDRVQVTGRLWPPGTSDRFSYADYLARQGVFSVMSGAILVPLNERAGFAPLLWLADLRDAARQHIQAGLPEPQAGLLVGILLGDESTLDPELREDFGIAGASHIIAISGFNMALVGGFALALIQRAGFRRAYAAWAALALIWVYALFVGGGPSVARAAAMSSLLLLAPLLRRRTYLPASLAFAALLLSLQEPRMLYDLGFQLSFAAVLGMALLVEPLTAALSRVLAAPGLSWLREPLSATLAAQIATLPILVAHLGTISLAALPVNLLILGVQPLILMAGALAVLVALLLPVLAQPLFWVLLLPLLWTTSIVRFFSGLPLAAVPFEVDGRVLLFLGAALTAALLLRTARPRRWQRLIELLNGRGLWWASGGGTAAYVVLALAFAWSRPDGMLHIWWLDVGHSHGVLIQTPSGAHVLIDGGRQPARLLAALGDRLPFYDRRLELLILTHPDEQDFAALVDVAQRYEIGLFASNGQPNIGERFQRLDSLLAETPRVVLTAGYAVDFWDGTRLEVLHPQRLPRPGAPLGDDALVLRLSYGEVSILLTSDLSRTGQDTLLDAGIDLSAAVLVLPQHGRARSLDLAFLEAVQPQVAVVQADVANRQGDPDADVLALLADLPLFRTDTQGTLHLWTSGVDSWVQPTQ